MIINNSGGGVPLNFKIVGGTTEPTNPKENTIWVNTDTAIKGWHFSADDPFIGEVVEDAGAVLWAISNSLYTYNYSKANGGKALKIQCRMEINGSEESVCMLLSSEKNACAVVRREKVNGTTETVEASDSIVLNGKTYYYITAVHNAVHADDAAVPYRSFEELARALALTFDGEGAVWFITGTTAKAPMNAIKKNSLWVYPNQCGQRIGGVWVEKMARTYQGGVWNEWITYLFNGTVNEALTGGINGTVSNGVISFSASGMAAGNNKTYSTVNPIDLTPFTKLCATVTSDGTVSGPYFRLAVLNSASNGSKITDGNTVCSVFSNAPFNGEERTVELDISDLSGSYYPSHAGGVYSSGGTKNFSYTISSWWVE